MAVRATPTDPYSAGNGRCCRVATQDGDLGKLGFDPVRSGGQRSTAEVPRREYVTDEAFAKNVGRVAGPDPGVRPRFVDVRFTRTDAGDTIYAVALDELVYRFSADGEPDRLLSQPGSED